MNWFQTSAIKTSPYVPTKIHFCKNKEITQNLSETALVWFFVISLTSGHSNKVCMHLFNPKAYFHFLNVNFTLSAFYELLKSTATLSTFFTLYDVWNALWPCFSPFELWSNRLHPFSDVKRYNYMLLCQYCKAWNSYAIKVKCSIQSQAWVW